MVTHATLMEMDLVRGNDQDREELSKEAYARFGLAYFLSECLHRGLCNAYAFGAFTRLQEIARPRIEEKLAHAYSLTLGQVVGLMEGLVPDELFLRLGRAVEKRNYLAHHFWFDKIHLMFSTDGIRTAIEDLAEYAALFQELDAAVGEWLQPRLTKLGLTDEILAQCLDEVLSGKPEEPFPCKRKLRKAERLVRVWEDVRPGGARVLVFETEDDSLWQLCEAGLGWGGFESVQDHWQESPAFRPYLPATINPRPCCQGPWHYDIELGKGVVFWVRPGKGAVGFLCGIRKRKGRGGSAAAGT